MSGNDTGLWCIVPAAGSGTRFGAATPKQYLTLAGAPMLLQTLRRLASHPRIAGIVVVLAPDDAHWDALECDFAKPVLTAAGGATRAESVLAGIDALPVSVSPRQFVLVHDAARPCVRHADITRLIDLAGAGEGGLLASPLRDTLKRSDASGHVAATEPREGLWRALTPQMFRRGALGRALLGARDAGIEVTDEAMAMERAGATPLLVPGSDDNIKVTTPADMRLAEFLLGIE